MLMTGRNDEMVERLEEIPCMICGLIKDKCIDYKMDEPKSVWLIKPIRDGVLNKMIGRDQSKVYTMCSKHSRVISRLIDEYITEYTTKLLTIEEPAQTDG